MTAADEVPPPIPEVLHRLRQADPPKRHEDLPQLSHDVWHGPAGEHAQAIAPSTEADPVAVLAHDLAWASARIGAGTWVAMGRERHPARNWFLLNGPTAVGRKGTAQSATLSSLSSLSSLPRIVSGLSSGEGLIEAFLGEPPPDERLLVTESEWEGPLARMKREGNTLSAVLRDAWDGRPLATLNVASRMVEHHHLVVVGHITPASFRHAMTGLDVSNGFLNRFLMLSVRRPHLIDPFSADDCDDDHAPLRRIVERTGTGIPNGPIGLTVAARKAFHQWYREAEGTRDSLPERVAQATARYTGHAIRLALTYAILDGASKIDVPHVAAGIGLVDYANECAAEELAAGRVGLDGQILLMLRLDSWTSRTAIHAHLGRRVKSHDLDEALGLIAKQITSREVSTDGRTRTEYKRLR